uniref:Putative LAGLIDADG homing endonuclease n=1 Tax=Carteria sp. SAG 8-5 TaxID=1756294 RepID=A0A0S2LQK2_9CHLO|nr:putative LAGLIDADG homing endonuclease [Carteria sp. SAG 8-5]ALO63402.1 putative LAGLIDADG homing endonuclease [Carteria sp. SAG 8-5]
MNPKASKKLWQRLGKTSRSWFNSTNSKIMNKFTPDQLLYLAGLIDGDGSIIAQLVSRKDYTWEFQIRLTVQVTQLKKRRWFLEELQKEIGAGSVRDRDTVSDYILTETSNVYKFLKRPPTTPAIKTKTS